MVICVLLPTWGWAKERTMEPPGVDFMICGTDWSNGRNWNNCVVEPLLLQRYVACYQRMQAAMRAVEPYLQQSTDIRSVQPIYKSPSTQLRDAADAVEAEDVAVEQFRATMRDCVEETK